MRIVSHGPSRRDIEKIVRIVEIICKHCEDHPAYGMFFRMFKAPLVAWLRNPVTGKDLRDRIIMDCMEVLRE